MSPIVYVPPKKHVCEPPRQGDTFDSRADGAEWYPERTIWECEKCARRWELRYDLWLDKTYTLFGRRKTYGYYEVNWRRLYD